MKTTEINQWIAKASTPSERINCPAFKPLATQDEVIIADRLKHWQAVWDASAFSKEQLLDYHQIKPEQQRQSILDVEIVDELALPIWAKNFCTLFEKWQQIIAQDKSLLEVVPEATTLETSLFCYSFGVLAKFQLDEIIITLKNNHIQLEDKAITGLLAYFIQRLYNPVINITTTYYQSYLHSEQKNSVDYDYNSFDAWLLFLKKQPILSRVIGTINDDWLMSSCEMLLRFNQDITEIKNIFFNNQTQQEVQILDILPGLGDPHRGGRSVAIISTNLGQVVYKPKNLSGTEFIGDLLKQFHELAPDFVPLAPKFINKGDYGWEQKVTAVACVNKTQVKTYYQRLGAWLRLLQVFNANDFWYDNLIAVGDMPYFIDYETIIGVPFTPEHNVLNTLSMIGILPRIMPANQLGQDPIDISCMVTPGEQRTPIKSNSAFKGKDGKPSNLVLEAQDFACYLNADFQDIAYYFSDFQQGFRRINELLLDNLAIVQQFLKRIEHSRFRHIFIDTWSAYDLINMTNNKPFSDGVRWEIAHDSLFQALAYYQFNTISSAIDSVKRNDIPIYELSVDSVDAYTSDNQVIKNAFPKSPADYIADNLKNLETVEEDLSIVRSLYSLRNQQHRPSFQVDNKITHYQPLDIAQTIADQLSSFIISDKSDLGITQITVSIDMGYKSLQPLTYDFYGASALVLFFDKLYRITKTPKYLQTLKTLFLFLQTSDTQDMTNFNMVYDKFKQQVAIITAYQALKNHFAVEALLQKCYEQLSELISQRRFSAISHPLLLTSAFGILTQADNTQTYVKKYIQALSQQLTPQTQQFPLTPWLQTYVSRTCVNEYLGLELAKSYHQQPSLLEKLTQFTTQDNHQISTANLIAKIYLGTINTDDCKQILQQNQSKNIDLEPTDNILDRLYEQLYFKKYQHQETTEIQTLSLVLINRFKTNGQWFCDSWEDDKQSISALYGLVDIGFAFLAQYNNKDNINPARLVEQ